MINISDNTLVWKERLAKLFKKLKTISETPGDQLEPLLYLTYKTQMFVHCT